MNLTYVQNVGLFLVFFDSFVEKYLNILVDVYALSRLAFDKSTINTTLLFIYFSLLEGNFDIRNYICLELKKFGGYKKANVAINPLVHQLLYLCVNVETIQR